MYKWVGSIKAHGPTHLRFDPIYIESDLGSSKIHGLAQLEGLLLYCPRPNLAWPTILMGRAGASPTH